MPGYQQIAGQPQIDSGGNFRVQTGYGVTGGKKLNPLTGQYE